MNFRVRRSGLLGAAFVSALTAAAAQAATGPTQEIVVTARRVEESLQDVPLSVTPFTAEQIEQLNLRNIDDLALFTPGFSFTSAFGRQPGSDRPMIRGITTIVNGVANDSSVAYFIDGVYLGGSPQSTELFNVERVEILKGPQAAQFGRGTYVGAINYVTKGASDTLEGQVEAQAGEDGWFRALGSLSGPITDNLGYYVGLGYDTFDGQFTNQRTGGDLGGEESTNVTAKLFWEPTETLDVTFKLGYQETDDDHFPMYLQPRGLNNCCFRGAAGSGINPRNREYYVGEAQPNWDDIRLFTDVLDATGGSGSQLERTLAALTVRWEVAPDITISSLTGWVEDETTTAFDVSYAAYEPFPFPPQFAGAFNQRDVDEQSDFSQELRINFNNIDRLRITAGLYYYKGEANEIRDDFVTATGQVLPGSNGSSANPFTGEVTLVNEEIENFAVFGGVDWDVTDRLTLGVEARYAEDEITVSDAVAASGCTAELCNETFDSFTPRVTARYRLTDNINIYGNVAQGTRPGNFNSLVPDLDGDGLPDENLRAVDEEEAWNYEIGLKSTLWGGRATVNVAAYYMDVQDQQLTQVIELPGGFTTSILQNVGETEIFGIEFDSGVAITDFWTAGVTYSYIDSEIKQRISLDQADISGWDGDPATLAQFGNVAGNQTPRVPEHMFSLFTRYERPFAGGDNRWFISADWAFEGSKFSQEHNLIETGDRNLVGLQAGVAVGNWQFTVWGRNIFDDETPQDILRYIDRRSGTLPSCNSVLGGPPFPTLPACAGSTTSPRGFALTPQRQRQIGATLNYRFGGTR